MAERTGNASIGGPAFDLDSGWTGLPPAEEASETALAGYHEILTADVLRQVRVRLRPLAFFPGVRLVHVSPRREGDVAAAHALWSRHGFHWLRGGSDDIFAAIEREDFLLSDRTVLAYHGFFCFFIHGDEGPFRVIPSAAALNGHGGAGFGPVDPRRMQALIQPPRARRLEGPGWAVEATVQYGNTLFRAAFRVRPDGQVEMVGDEPLVEGVPVPRRHAVGPSRSGWPESAGDARDLLAALGLSPHTRFIPPYASERRLEWSVVREVVRTQLIDALRGGGARPLFEAADDAGDDAVLAAFARFALDSHPLVLLESTTPFIEATVWELLRQAGGEDRTVREPAEAGGDGEGTVDRLDDGDVLLVSLHRFPRLRRPRALAHRLGVTEALALVGCDTLRAVPEPMARIADGSLGFTGLAPDPRHVLTRAACQEYLQVLLAGRAAEELVYGSDGISSGAGGGSPGCDLAQATNWAAEMLCRLGLDTEAPLQWREEPAPADLERLEAMLSRSYDAVLACLRDQAPLFHRLVEELMARQELSAGEVAALAAHYAAPGQRPAPAAGGE